MGEVFDENAAGIHQGLLIRRGGSSADKQRRFVGQTATQFHEFGFHARVVGRIRDAERNSASFVLNGGNGDFFGRQVGTQI
jgi:hypothetical protein